VGSNSIIDFAPESSALDCHLLGVRIDGDGFQLGEIDAETTFCGGGRPYAVTASSNSEIKSMGLGEFDESRDIRGGGGVSDYSLGCMSAKRL
jgi:hypothetical protein